MMFRYIGLSLVVLFASLTSGGCSSDVCAMAQPSRKLSLVDYQAGRVIVFMEYGDTRDHRIQWSISLNSNGILRDGGSTVSDDDIRDTFKQGTVRVNIYLNDPSATTYDTVSKALRRILDNALPALKIRDSLIIYIRPHPLETEFEPGGVEREMPESARTGVLTRLLRLARLSRPSSADLCDP